MVIGYSDKVNYIVIVTKDMQLLKRHLSVYGLNVYPNSYSYYDMQGQLHMINMDYVKAIKLYHDKQLIRVIEN